MFYGVGVSYRYVTERADYGDLASGLVLHSAPGFPAFPVRLASEAFLRARAQRGGDEPLTVWDPCCGSGYLLSVIGLLHRRDVGFLLASDFDPAAVDLAGRNLALLDPASLEHRARVLEEHAERFDKDSYRLAAASARRLAGRLAAAGGPLPSAAHQADAFDPGALAVALAGRQPDIVITDVPYGEQTRWQGPGRDLEVPGMLAAVASVLRPQAVLTVMARGRRVPLGTVRPVESFKVGTRAVALLPAGRISG